MCLVESHVAQNSPFAWARRCVHIEGPGLGQLYGCHADTARGSVYEYPLARADACGMRQRVVRGKEDGRHRRCFSVGPPRRDAHDPPVIHVDNWSHAEELTHHSVAWFELEYIVGDVENNARTLDADVVLGGVAERGQDVVKIHAAAAQSETHLARPKAPLGFGTRAQG